MSDPIKHEWTHGKVRYLARYYGEEPGIVWGGLGSEPRFPITASILEGVFAGEILSLAKALRGLLPPLLDALRNAADLDGHAIYNLLADTGIIRREPYDPEIHKAGEYVEALALSKPGEEIWVLTELGKRFAGKEG